ncbi:tRNA (guanine-N(7)-)-methyltransferase non-catalytic subunit wdr4-like [Uloborus diversus]|uniref:tRNA (guanine-N(7)-)-methyltransferase non-catalytic subunit wdr4-like n=1 Tax=Uloborus diversus TaxID=327109 RepID=UPI00240999EE|nr:tRNA (guanine-N(7)-)-methyltransferase non-catalytic subunit wdr4-like [Uloborus diversus]
MASFINNKNVGVCGFVNSNEFILWDVPHNDVNGELISHKLKCIAKSHTEEDKEVNSNVKVEVNDIVSIAISNSFKFIAASDFRNSLYLWGKVESSFKLISVRSLSRRCHKLIFTNSGSNVIVSDRGGDVFLFSVSNFDDSGKLILGHICLITDIAISENDDYLATCDRDAKIRISCFPNCYNIHSYCLGHQDFISSLHFLPFNNEVLFSSSGDGTLRLWNFKSGTEICSLHIEEKIFLENKKLDEASKIEKSSLSKEKKNENDSNSAVKMVTYCNKFKMCAVSFHTRVGVALYEIADKSLSFNFVQYISLLSIPLSISFDANGTLFIILANLEKPILMYECCPANKMHFTQVTDVSKTCVVREIYKFCPDIRDIKSQNDFEILKKRVFDDDETSCNKKVK